MACPCLTTLQSCSQPGGLLTPCCPPIMIQVGVIQTKPENIKTREHLRSLFCLFQHLVRWRGESKQHLQCLRTLKFFYYKSLYNEVPDTAMQLYWWSYISIYCLYIDIVFTCTKVKLSQTA